jgi:hypothetical protein
MDLNINKRTYSKNDNINNDYLFFLEGKIFENIKIPKNLDKIDEVETIPNFTNYEVILKYNYNIKQLKQIAKEYKLKLSGNKSQLVTRIYSYLYLSKLAIKIQKIIRGCLQRKYDKNHGPGFKDRTLCINNFDFLSMDELTTIEDKQFFSFKDEDGFIYGFDILSLYNLIYKSNGAVKNPFNQQPLSSRVIENFRSLLRLSRVLKIKILTEISDITNDVSDKKSVELRAVTLFQNIDALGNYSNVQWFLTLNRQQLIKFVRELVDIWQYRANLSNEVKKAICYPSGNPFQRMPHYGHLQTLENLDDVRKIILDIMEKLVNSGIDNDNKCLGAYYVLSAMTLVNLDAATSLPWLYDAAYHM